MNQNLEIFQQQLQLFCAQGGSANSIKNAKFCRDEEAYINFSRRYNNVYMRNRQKILDFWKNLFADNVRDNRLTTDCMKHLI